jgi:glycosyltransferase involved in cell wall biosynthesis
VEKLRPIILVICDYYLPGFESGGALRTLVNMVDGLSDDFDFRIITRDHDGKLNRNQYTSVKINTWNRIGKSEVYYLSKDQTRAGNIRQLVNEISPDVIYLNSFFSPLSLYVLSLQRLRKIREIPIVLAPEGEFSQGALSLKSAKKKLYIAFCNLFHMVANVKWKAAAEAEADDIKRVIGGKASITLAPNMSPAIASNGNPTLAKPPKEIGTAHIVYLSRVMRKKNLKWLLRRLQLLEGGLVIDIFGTLEDREYWEECQRTIQSLPPNIRVTSKGPVPHEEVADVLAKYHFFVLPTLGENFGHVFLEALAAGCPLIISDRTPWRNLESKGIGWDMSLDRPEEWVSTINRCITMNDEEYRQMSRNSLDFSTAWLSDAKTKEANRKLLSSAVKRG